MINMKNPMLINSEATFSNTPTLETASRQGMNIIEKTGRYDNTMEGIEVNNSVLPFINK